MGYSRPRRNKLTFDELNPQLHADLPAQQLQENSDSAFSIGGVLNDGNQTIKRTTTDLYLLSRPQLRVGLNQPVAIGLLLEKSYDPFVERNRPIAETDQAFHPRRPNNVMKLGREMKLDKEIIGEKWDDSPSIFSYSDEIQAWKKNLETFHAQMKLRLFLFMWFTVNHIPISLYVFQAAAL
jgi:hypothetical protein